MANCPVIGARTRTILEPGESAYTFDANSLFHRLNWETLRLIPSWVEVPALTGDMHWDDADIFEGPRYVAGDLNYSLRPGELKDALAFWIGTESPAGTFEVENGDPPYFGALMDKVAGVYEFQDMRVNRVMIRSRSTTAQGGSPQPADMTISVIGKDRASGSWPGSPPSLGTGEEYKPFMHEESTLTIAGTDYRAIDFVLMIDYFMRPTWYDGLTPDDICPQAKRLIRLRARFPWATPEAPLLTLADDPGVDGNLLWSYATNGGAGSVSTNFIFGKLKSIPQDPNARGQGPMGMVVDFRSSADAGSAEPDLQVVNDAVTAT